MQKLAKIEQRTAEDESDRHVEARVPKGKLVLNKVITTTNQH